MSAYRINAEDPDERTRLVRRNRALERWFRVAWLALWPVRASRALRARWHQYVLSHDAGVIPESAPAVQILKHLYFDRDIDGEAFCWDGATAVVVQVMSDGSQRVIKRDYTDTWRYGTGSMVRGDMRRVIDRARQCRLLNPDDPLVYKLVLHQHAAWTRVSPPDPRKEWLKHVSYEQ